MAGANRPAESNARPLAGNGRRNWIVRNVSWLKSFVRVILGIVWLIELPQVLAGTGQLLPGSDQVRRPTGLASAMVQLLVQCHIGQRCPVRL